MAVFTELTTRDAQRVAKAHGLPRPDRVVPIPEGSVNSNFFFEAAENRWFFRIYEEQDEAGAAYEWALLEHLRGRGVPVPARVVGPEPGAIRVKGKPVAFFETVPGTATCQAGVTEARARAVGGLLAAAHSAADDFLERREGRFGPADLSRRLEQIESKGQEELARIVPALRSAILEGADGLTRAEDRGVIHGDLFRDNVRWDGDRVVAVIDWESASDGPRVYDLAVAILAWCFGDALDWTLARALCRGYDDARPLTAADRRAVRAGAVAAAARFTTTRITDYTLRKGKGDRVMKDWRRFQARLDTVRALDAEELEGRLFG